MMRGLQVLQTERTLLVRSTAKQPGARGRNHCCRAGARPHSSPAPPPPQRLPLPRRSGEQARPAAARAGAGSRAVAARVSAASSTRSGAAESAGWPAAHVNTRSDLACKQLLN